MDEMLMILGASDLLKSSMNSLENLTPANKLMLKESCQSSSESAKKFSSFKTAPTLLTRMSRPPKVSTTLSWKVWISSMRARSAGRNKCPAPEISPARLDKRRASRAQPATFAPALAKANARARPMPSPAPVTTTFRSFKFISMLESATVDVPANLFLSVPCLPKLFLRSALRPLSYG